MAPGFLQPLLFPQLQSLLPDKVERVLEDPRKFVALFLDHVQDHLHVVYLILRLGRLLVVLMCVPVLLEIVNPTAPPFTTFERAEHPIREVEGLVVPIPFLLAAARLPT
jgi:hypothetical protein